MTHKPQPVDRPFWTPGVLVMLVLMIGAGLTLAVRYTYGLAAVTNLNNHYPWGIWIGLDVASGVALAAGGFTTAFLGHILGRHYYESVTRPALLTAALGYTFVALAVFFDIGRSWAIWKPVFFQNHNSALFEVAMCVMVYVSVLWIEFIPVLAERLGSRIKLLAVLNRLLDKTMWVFIILGVVLSCMHQSSLGTLLVIAPTKVSPLWYTPYLPLLFLTSAFAVGYPMVIVETTIATSSLKLESEMNVLSPLSRITILLLGVYMFLKIGDLVVRGAYTTLLDGSAQSNSFLVEVALGVVLPWLMLLFPAVRRSRRLLFTAALLIVSGVMLNRFNVFVVSFKAPYANYPYYPAIGEILVTVGAVATIFFLYRLIVTWFPVLSAQRQEVSQ
ncbi:Ni/Fe-hydrogenase cytochrome b subunit [Pseudodesulfovibrio thermohalotolerans]|uniref:NrfD/PsrC family molybdoenzyme membrane anchor subunit n=1 Tax=Pseudodesulfovibrio thermohalotolerans TaxID=2880651 RepID=UPI0022B9F985|nr:Ni/Fe-hydrogenase cytochrome b subunit [Pseudodesulfovibrio thermohalotolerans]WFS63326.1 Ni/Fe-hydrogenase cytochrome b subunit [Pseudodesulfovibrio thermohalotolerans]